VTVTDLGGKTILMSGGSRGIGLAIALRAAHDGANVALLAKTATPHSTLAGTVFSAAERIEEAGGRALPIVGDVRDADVISRAVDLTVETFGGLDICINNAGAIWLSGTRELEIAHFDLMHNVNVRGAYLLSRACIPHLMLAPNPHILSLSPPLNLQAKWLGAHIGYTMSKYAMSLMTLGLSAELADEGIAVNSLWPRTVIATAALRQLPGDSILRARSTEIMADAAHLILCSPSGSLTGHLFLDEEVLLRAGVSDLSHYAPGIAADQVQLDLFVDL
jgi:citronellol/citronellal dehydrogenase